MTDVEELLAAIRSTQAGRNRELRADQLRAWMARPELRVRSEVYALLKNHRDAFTVTPALPDREYLHFYRQFLEAVMRAPADTLPELTRHGAAYEIAGWLAAICEDPATPRRTLVDFRDWLASLYTGGPDELRNILVTGALEHLFERPAVRALFRDWKDDPVLGKAWADAMLWVKGGGDSPLIGRRRQKR